QVVFQSSRERPGDEGHELCAVRQPADGIEPAVIIVLIGDAELVGFSQPHTSSLPPNKEIRYHSAKTSCATYLPPFFFGAVCPSPVLPISLSNSPSVSTGTPSSFALSSLLPASSPATT